MDQQTLLPPTRAAAKPIWDVAEKPFCCGQCHGTVGQGEAYRVSRVANRHGLCEDCSVALDGETLPDYIQPRTFLDRLHAESTNHRLGKQPSTGPLVMTPGSQPTIEPRGQRQTRHGVVSAMRRIIDEQPQDWRRRQSGERDE